MWLLFCGSDCIYLLYYFWFDLFEPFIFHHFLRSALTIFSYWFLCCSLFHFNSYCSLRTFFPFPAFQFIPNSATHELFPLPSMLCWYYTHGAGFTLTPHRRYLFEYSCSLWKSSILTQMWEIPSLRVESKIFYLFALAWLTALYVCLRSTPIFHFLVKYTWSVSWIQAWPSKFKPDNCNNSFLAFLLRPSDFCSSYIHQIPSSESGISVGWSQSLSLILLALQWNPLQLSSVFIVHLQKESKPITWQLLDSSRSDSVSLLPVLMRAFSWFLANQELFKQVAQLGVNYDFLWFFLLQ